MKGVQSVQKDRADQCRVAETVFKLYRYTNTLIVLWFYFEYFLPIVHNLFDAKKKKEKKHKYKNKHNGAITDQQMYDKLIWTFISFYHVKQIT